MTVKSWKVLEPTFDAREYIPVVRKSDYDALAARLAEAERLLRKFHESGPAGIAALIEEVPAFLGIADSADPTVTAHEHRDWQMFLKGCPDTEFIKFFEDNPEMSYVVHVAQDSADAPRWTQEQIDAVNRDAEMLLAKMQPGKIADDSAVVTTCDRCNGAGGARSYPDDSYWTCDKCGGSGTVTVSADSADAQRCPMDERAEWGECPVCHAPHGERCRPVTVDGVKP